MPYKIKSISQLNHEINIAPMVERFVSGELMKIENKIKTDLDSGQTSTAVSLTYNFNIPNMHLQDAQIMIYAEIIRRMEQEGYRGLEIDMQEGQTALHIPLRTMYEKYQQEEAKAILNQHLRKHKKNPMINNSAPIHGAGLSSSYFPTLPANAGQGINLGVNSYRHAPNANQHTANNTNDSAYEIYRPTVGSFGIRHS